MHAASLASGGNRTLWSLTRLLLHFLPLLAPITRTGAGPARATYQDANLCDTVDGTCPVAASQELLQREVLNGRGSTMSVLDYGPKDDTKSKGKHVEVQGKKKTKHEDGKSKTKFVEQERKDNTKNKLKHLEVEGKKKTKLEDGKIKTKLVEQGRKNQSKHEDDNKTKTIRVKLESEGPEKTEHEENREKVVELRNNDFANGSYIITRPGTYVLQEDIVFEPATPGHFPLNRSTVYKQADGYWLGFFAAIVVTTSDVVIDLSGYSISMSFKFSVIQRFFSVIQLGSKPFLSGQGPPHFAMSSVYPEYASQVEIKNGVVGRSSHMGIHGNNVFGLHIHDVKIMDFETGGIQLNGAESVTIERCTIGPSLGAPGSANKVPGLAVFTQATLLAHLARGTGHSDEKEVTELGAAIDSYTKSIISAELPAPRKSTAFFSDPDTYTGLPDGAALYGIHLHKTGVAVHDFAMCSWTQADQLQDDPLTNLTIRDVVIQDLSLKSDEVVAMSFHGLPVRGPAGDTIQVLKLKNTYDEYHGTALSNAQRRLAELKLQARKDGLSEDDIFNLYGSTNIPPAVLSWMQGNGSYADAVVDADFECQKDAMGHHNKGVVGLRVDMLHQVTVSNISITRLKNFGHRSVHHDFCGAEKDEDFDYNGADVRGVSLGVGTSLNVADMEDHVTLNEASFYSATGWVYPIKEEIDTPRNEEVAKVEWEVFAPVLFR